MSQQNDDALVDLFKRAAAIASAVPEAMQDAAFHRALDLLQGGKSTQAPVNVVNQTHKSDGGSSSHKTPASSAKESPVELLRALDRSKMSGVDDEKDDALAKSLALLRAAHAELGIDGLSAPQIAQVLTEKFRWRITRQAVQQRMDKAGRLVDRVSTGKGATIYRLMVAGERYLDTPHDDRKLDSTPSRRPKGKTAVGATKTKSKISKPDNSAAEPAVADGGTKRQVRSSRPGPKRAIETLIADGYFAQPRMVQQIREQLDHNRGLRFKPTDLSPAMTRLLRENKLKRVKNAENQYEYSTS